MIAAGQLDELAGYLENLGGLSSQQSWQLHEIVQNSGMSFEEQWDIIIDQFPEIITAYEEQSMVVTAEWWANNADSMPELVVPETVADPKKVRDALTLSYAGVAAEHYDDLFLALSKAWAYRSVFEAQRTMMANYIADNGLRYARHAQPGACAFCRFMACRGGVYRPEPLHEKSDEEMAYLHTLETLEGSERYKFMRTHKAIKRQNKHLGRLNQDYAKFHDHCRCMVVPAPVYKKPDYLLGWERLFDETYTGELKSTLAAMREADPLLHH